MESLRGMLLVAAPSLADPNFVRTVILVGEHSDEGALGVVLNRPSDTTVAEAVPDLAPLVAEDDVVHVGGPVQPSAVLVLAEHVDPTAAGQLVVGDVGFLAVDEGDELGGIGLTDGIARARVFAGYAGWGPGQLESELERDDWITARSDAEDVFDEDAETLWSRVLERMGGQYRLVARMPVDPTLN